MHFNRGDRKNVAFKSSKIAKRTKEDLHEQNRNCVVYTCRCLLRCKGTHLGNFLTVTCTIVYCKVWYAFYILHCTCTCIKSHYTLAGWEITVRKCAQLYCNCRKVHYKILINAHPKFRACYWMMASKKNQVVTLFQFGFVSNTS